MSRLNRGTPVDDRSDRLRAASVRARELEAESLPLPTSDNRRSSPLRTRQNEPVYIHRDPPPNDSAPRAPADSAPSDSAAPSLPPLEMPLYFRSAAQRWPNGVPDYVTLLPPPRRPHSNNSPLSRRAVNTDRPGVHVPQLHAETEDRPDPPSDNRPVARSARLSTPPPRSRASMQLPPPEPEMRSPRKSGPEIVPPAADLLGGGWRQQRETTPGASPHRKRQRITGDRYVRNEYN